ncbi:VirB4 family type IV secretion system protein [Deinococcus ficus]|uniref:Type IV secretion system protein VirB4 n=1 Tax=Deinococcus ficus TaxID=317577 RepID=A0A221T319_9DEIO|nr:hypothetical protein [Deinococcus ficus]ASN83285.1 type IV secretion system protein VirB4 [Deinococcus ficus]
MSSNYRRNRRQSLTDRLQYWGIRDGVVITRQKGIEFGIEFRLPSAAEVTDPVREQLATLLHQIMVQCVPEQCRGRLIIESAPLNENQLVKASEGQNVDNELLKFLKDENNRIMEKRRVEGMLSSWRYFFTVRLDNRQKKIGRPVPFMSTELDPLVKRAISIRTQMVNMMDAAGFEARSLTGQEAFGLIYRWFNPGLAASREPLFKSIFKGLNASRDEIRKDLTLYSDSMREQVTNSEVDSTRIDALVVGDRLVQTINMLGVGETTYPGMSERMLMRLSGHHVYYILDLEHLKQSDERKKLNDAARGAILATQDASMGTPDLGNVAVVGGLSNILQRMTAGEERVFRFGISMVLIARDKSELEHMKEIARTEMSMMGGAKAAYGTFQNIPQYFDRLAPLNAQTNEFMFKAFSSNVIHFIPLVGPWAGSNKPIALFRSRWGSVTGINPSDGTLNQGMLIVGSAGSGKTFVTQSWAAQMAAVGADLVIVDQKRDYESFISSLEGQFIPFAPGEKVDGKVVRLNAFELPPGEYVPDEQHKIFLMGFITALLGSGELPPQDKAIITAAIEQAYATSYTINAAGDVKHSVVTLSTLVTAIRELNAVGTVSLKGNTEAQSIINRLTLSLQTYVGDTAMGSFLDGESTVEIKNPYVYFDIAKIKDDPSLTRVALLLIIKQIWERAKKNRDKPKVAIIEEIGVLFSIPEALAFVASLYKLGRTYNLWPVGVTQEIGDFQKGKGLINNTSQFLIGRVSAEEAETVAEVLGLNSASLDLIRSLGGQKGVYREYLAMTIKESGMTGDVVQYFPNPIEYWMFTSHPAEVDRRQKTVELHGGNVLAAVKSLAGRNQGY